MIYALLVLGYLVLVSATYFTTRTYAKRVYRTVWTKGDRNLALLFAFLPLVNVVTLVVTGSITILRVLQNNNEKSDW